jgi:hypothetical protein
LLLFEKFISETPEQLKWIETCLLIVGKNSCLLNKAVLPIPGNVARSGRDLERVRNGYY